MPRRYTSRQLNNPEDTAHMQSLLQKKPEKFFLFPPEWQEWFMTHPDWLNSLDGKASLGAIRGLLYGKIMMILLQTKGEWGPELSALVTLLMNSGIEQSEILEQLRILGPKKSS